MKQLSKISLLLFALCSIQISARALDVTNPEVVEAFVDGVVISNMKTHHSPSGVVALMIKGEIILAKGYGYIDIDERIPVNPETSLFRPGSISKLFTWTAVMQQVEQGKLDLDVDVNQYLETFKIKDSWPGQPVTLRHIMTHTAGFEDGGLGYLILNDEDRIMPLAKSMAKYQPTRVNPPGAHVAYSNWATSVAGLIVSNVSGIPFSDYIEKNIFVPLGMKNSSFREPLPEVLNENMAKAYGYSRAKYIEQNYEIISNFAPAGALAATAYDMVRFAKALLNGGALDGNRILKTETLQQMIDGGFAHDKRVRGMGLGFVKRRFGPEGFDNFGHDGGTTIFLSHFGLSLKEDLMLFSSFSGPGASQTHGAFVQAFYDEFFPPLVEHLLPPEGFFDRGARYTGTYHSTRNSFTKVEAITRALAGVKVFPLDDNTLMIGPKRFIEIEENLFREFDGSARIAFQENKEGEVTGFVIDGTGILHMLKVPFYQTADFILLVFAFSYLVFIGVFFRLAYQWSTYRALASREKRAYRSSLFLALCNILFLVFISLSMIDQQALMYNVPLVLKAALVFSNLAALAALDHLYQSYRVWGNGLCESNWVRVRFSVISLVGILMTCFYVYWNFLGFQYYS